MKQFFLILSLILFFIGNVALSQETSSNDIKEKIQLNAFSLFKDLITSEVKGEEKLRQTEFAIRLLEIFKGTFGRDIAYAIAANSNECAKVRKIAFNIGMEMDQIWFSEKILGTMNIILGINNNKFDENKAKRVRKELKNYDSGYPLLVRKIFSILSGQRLKGNPISFEQINGYNLTVHGNKKGDYTPIVNSNKLKSNKLKTAILNAWNSSNDSNVRKELKHILEGREVKREKGCYGKSK